MTATRTIIHDLLDALRGTEQDYTRGSTRRAVVLLAIPMILEMAMESVFAIVDVFFVAGLGPSAVATVGITESILTLVYAVAIGLSMGTTAMVARRIGEKKPGEAADTAVQAVIVGILGSIPIALLGWFFARQVLATMGADAWSIEHGSRYAMWMLGGNVVIMLIFICNAIFRGAGDAAMAMRILWLANGINIFLDPALIRGWGPFPEMGIEGAAVATNIGRAVGVAVQLFVLARGAKHIRVLVPQIRVRAALLGRLVRLSLGGIAQLIIATSSWVGLVRIMATFGSEAMAGYTIAVRIIMFTFLPSWGLSNAAATLVGQNLGARQPDRAERSAWMIGWTNMVLLGLVGLCYYVFDEQLVRIFTRDSGVIASGADCLRTVSVGYPFYAWGMVLTQAFNGAGDTVTPTRINLLCFWLLEIPFAYLFALRLGAGEPGVYWSIVLSESLVGLISIWIFRRGHWKLREV
ncbi:MAG TPA: MATE family efflux transporter [Candidatus Krumholzibacteria bacterium]|nr:MATE family efflux transporter [Candidatus Krumholzibacteria bacterium]